jgi:DNA-binding CsgD family transcriptional regulator
MAMIDDERHYVNANRPARLIFRLPLAEVRRRRLGDLTPASARWVMEAAWARLQEVGSVAGSSYELTGPDGGRLEVAYFGLAHALPGLHVGIFAPADWSEAEFGVVDYHEREPSAALTPRELQVLQLAADGLTGPGIAAELVVSPATVKTHFENIYEKFAVTDRAAAVATAMRLGLID